jgi:hypothetical protein
VASGTALGGAIQEVMMRTVIDQRLLVRPDCLMFFIDETGHEAFADPKYPVFGIGGCAVMAGAVDTVLKQPWRAMKAKHFGGADVPLHASDLRTPTPEQLLALSSFFREQQFGRFAVTITPACRLPAGIAPYHIVSAAIRKRWEELTPRFHPQPVELAFLHEASARGDALVQRYFSDTVAHIDGKRVPVHLGIMPKSAGDEALEVADFIVQAAGRQAIRWDGGDRRFRLDFQSVFHANPLWSSLNVIRGVS